MWKITSFFWLAKFLFLWVSPLLLIRKIFGSWTFAKKPQIKINSLKIQKNEYIIHIWSTKILWVRLWLGHALHGGSLDISTGALDISRGALDISRGSLDISTGALDISRGALDISRGALDISRGALDISIGSLDFSRGAHDISHERHILCWWGTYLLMRHIFVDGAHICWWGTYLWMRHIPFLVWTLNTLVQ